MSLVSQTKAAFQLYRLLLKDYYTQEAPYRLLDAASYFFPFTSPFCDRIIELFQGKNVEFLSEETLQEEKWVQLKQKLESVKDRFGITDEIFIGRDLSGKFPDYAISGNIILVNEENAFHLTDEAQFFAIAHELSHYVHRHGQKRVYMGCVWVIVDLSCVALVYYRSRLYFLVLGIAEIAIFHFDRAACRRQEKEADLTAIEKLGTNQGAGQFFFLHITFLGLQYLSPRNKKTLERAAPNNQDLIMYLFKYGLQLQECKLGKFALTHPPLFDRFVYSHLETSTIPRN